MYGENTSPMTNELTRLHIIVTGMIIVLIDVWWLSSLWLVGAGALLWSMRDDPWW